MCNVIYLYIIFLFVSQCYSSFLLFLLFHYCVLFYILGLKDNFKGFFYLFSIVDMNYYKDFSILLCFKSCRPCPGVSLSFLCVMVYTQQFCFTLEEILFNITQ